MAYDESDYDRDRETVADNGEFRVWYTNDAYRKHDVEEAKKRIEAYERGDYDDFCLL